ncbi:hypothetical protein ES708_22894 [subsurface metagenome]
MGKGLSKTIKKLIVKLHQGIPLTEEEDEFCLSLKQDRVSYYCTGNT